MKRQGQATPYAVRVKISELANEGKTDAQIAIELGDNYWTVRKWQRRFQQRLCVEAEKFWSLSSFYQASSTSFQ